MNEETVIKYFNIVMEKADKFDLFSINNNLLKEDFNPKTEKEKDEFFKLCGKIEKISIKLKFFEYEGSNGWYTLSDKGRKAKELGGYSEYLKYIEKRELESERLLVNNGNIIQGDNYGNQSSSNFSNNPQTHNIIENKKPTEKKNLIIKFWKLISENKLIAGILILVILYILKVKFGIDLRNP